MRMPASRELLASRREAWGFLAEPYHLPDRWPGAAGVQPDRLDVSVELEATPPERTRATVMVAGPWLLAFRRTLARRALNLLHALCQTAAAL